MTNEHVSMTRRNVVAASATAVALAGVTGQRSAGAEGAPSVAPKVKFVALLARKPSISREEFVRAWTIDHVRLAKECPGIARYVLTVIESSSSRSDVGTFELEMDGIAELYFNDEAAFNTYNNAPETKRLREHGASIIGRQLSFITYEVVAIPSGS
jgi:uncharacterized protein (TIGR02118 family)